MDPKPKARILVAEDNESTAQIIRFTLERAGFSVKVAGDGKEALVAAQQEQFDLVIVDEKMPLMSGRQLYLRLRDAAQYAEKPIIFVTAKRLKAESELIDPGDHSAIVIAKPFSPKVLVRNVEAALALSIVI